MYCLILSTNCKVNFFLQLFHLATGNRILNQPLGSIAAARPWFPQAFSVSCAAKLPSRDYQGFVSRYLLSYHCYLYTEPSSKATKPWIDCAGYFEALFACIEWLLSPLKVKPLCYQQWLRRCRSRCDTSVQQHPYQILKVRQRLKNMRGKDKIMYQRALQSSRTNATLYCSPWYSKV